MKKATAIKIVNNLGSEEYSTIEKLEALVEISQTSDLRKVTKASLAEGLHFALEVLKDVLSDNAAEEENAEC